MESDGPPIVLDLVLVGCGHAHVHVLKMFGMPAGRRLQQRLGLRLTLVSSHVRTPYSGMLPGYIAGHYSYDDIHLDCMQLARFANARFIHAAVNGITYNSRDEEGGGMIFTTDGRPPIRYDCLSIDIGSAPVAMNTLSGEDMMIPVKPIANLSCYWEGVVGDYRHHLVQNEQMEEERMDDVPYTVAIVGGGAGGIELALSIQHRLLEIQKEHPSPVESSELQVVVVTRGSTLMEAYGNRSVRRKFVRILKERNISVHCNAEVERVVGHTANGDSSNESKPSRRRLRKQLIFTSHTSAKKEPLIVDACVGCTSAGAASWLSTATPFTVTEVGHFLRIHDTYELLHHPGVFASGDCCHMDRHPRPKAGVYAVRAGPVLFTNLLRYLQRRPLLRHRPQATYLSLISTGDQYAVASKGRWFCLEGKWLWHAKDWIDRTWMAKYSTELPDLEKMMAKMRRQRHSIFGRRHDGRNGATAFLKHRKDNEDILEAFSKNAMRCGGCGAKVGATIVARVLKAVYQRQVIRAHELGYAAPPPIDHDDAAITLLPSTPLNGATTSNGAIVQTIDYFREMISDPFLFGKIVAVHALSDVHAMGTTAHTAMVLAVAPFAADDAITENTLTHLLSGVSDVLQDENIRLVGGHTCEGLELACGLSVQGFTLDPQTLWRKRGGRVGDKIVLTKPLGAGALFAAEMRGKASGEHVQEALEIMLQSNYRASCAAREFCCRHGNNVIRGCTDVTGFGLIGHLLEMLLANDTKSIHHQDNEIAVESIGAALHIRSIPFYRGGLQAASIGIFSSLQKQNARNRRTVANHTESAATFPTEYPLLYDPQTAGGLLFFINPIYCDEFVSQLKVSGHAKFATVIGEIQSYNTDVMMETTAHHSNQEMVSSVCVIGRDHLSTEHHISIDFGDIAIGNN